MMKAKFIILSLLAAIFFVSCESDLKEETATNSDPSSYFPLATGNMWTYKTPSMELTESINLIAVKNQSVNGKTYFLLVDSYNDSTYLRKDDAGNIVTPYGTKESIVIPAKPILDAYWFTPDSIDSLRITSITGQVNAYTDLLEIKTYDYATKALLKKDYYKKGVGMIRDIDSTTFVEKTIYSYKLK